MPGKERGTFSVRTSVDDRSQIETVATGADRETVWDYVPLTVMVVIAFSTLFAVAGIRPFQFYTSGEFAPIRTTFNFLNAHVLTMFMHKDAMHLLLNSLLLVLFGGTLTLLSSNEHVLGILLAAHVPWSFLRSVLSGSYGIGASLGVAGVIAATVLRTGAIALGRTSLGTARRLLGGAFALVVISGFLLLSLSGTLYLRIADHHIGGWVFGALAELGWLAYLIKRDQ